MWTPLESNVRLFAVKTIWNENQSLRDHNLGLRPIRCYRVLGGSAHRVGDRSTGRRTRMVFAQLVVNNILLSDLLKEIICRSTKQRLQQKSYLTSADRISPSTSSRLSDSDISELEYDDGFNTSRGQFIVTLFVAIINWHLISLNRVVERLISGHQSKFNR